MQACRSLSSSRPGTPTYHLLSKVNVVGTAIGYYLIRKDEPWPKEKGEGQSPPGKKTYVRTLLNSEVRDYSWPCVLAFVRSWAAESDFGQTGRYSPAQIVPKTLYMPDGRAVPVCVVEAPPGNVPNVGAPSVGPRPADLFGGGCPILVETQGELRQATAGALVTDGHTVYVLTARHACGEPGTEVDSMLRGGSRRIGASSSKQLTRLPFSKVYPDFPGRRSYSALDVGLVRIDVVSDWTSNTYTLPAVGPLADLHERNLSLRLIDQPVIGFGAASGLVRGRLKALFYRHRSSGGFDYVADFLIAPAEGTHVRPGDSGMVWHLDLTPSAERERTPLADHDLRPLAIEWGGQVFDDNGRNSPYAVATSLSAICRLLDIELVTDLGRGVTGYWGRTGHYSIAAIAIGLVKEPALKKLLQDNATLLSFELGEIEKAGFDKSVGKLGAADAFVPLADVPDEIWKKRPKSKGGRVGGRDVSGGPRQSDGPEHPTHYADIDVVHPQLGVSLRKLCLDDPDQYLTVEAWLRYYDALAAAAHEAGNVNVARQYRSEFKQGLLPFRIWQFFDAMTGFVAAGDVEGFVTAAGILAHYVGDASQPLHGSELADGDKGRPGPRNDEEGKSLPYGDGVHSAFETKMVSRFAPDLLPKAVAAADALPAVRSPGSGREAALLTVELMDGAATILPPQAILDAFKASGGGDRVAQLAQLYDSVGVDTAKLLALGARYLASLWEACWREGNGSAIPGSSLTRFAPEDVKARYVRESFVPSTTLKEIGSVLVS